MGFGQSKMTLDMLDVKDWNEIVSMVAAAAKQAKPGEWIIGRGWHREKWSSVPQPNVEGFPFHDALSKVSPNNPVMLTHASGHASFVNAAAMAAAGLTEKTPDPPGGEILKDKSGRPIGLLREAASGIVGRALDAWRAKKRPKNDWRMRAGRSSWPFRQASKRRHQLSPTPARTSPPSISTSRRPPTACWACGCGSWCATATTTCGHGWRNTRRSALPITI